MRVPSSLLAHLASSSITDLAEYYRVREGQKVEVVKFIRKTDTDEVQLLRAQLDTDRHSFSTNAKVSPILTVPGLLDFYAATRLRLDTAGAVRKQGDKLTIPRVTIAGAPFVFRDEKSQCCYEATVIQDNLSMHPVRSCDERTFYRKTSDGEYRAIR